MQFLRILLLALLMKNPFLHSATDQVAPADTLTPEQEFALLIACAEHPKEPLSIALKKLAQGIVPQELLDPWVQKFAALEAAKMDGEYVEHWDNGQIKLRATFKQGKVEGHVHGWYAEGCDAFKMFFEEEKKIGIHMAFFPSEVRRGRIGFGRLLTYNCDGKLDGEQKACYVSEDLKVIARYRAGLLHGELGFYDPNRKYAKRYQYKEGKLIAELKE